uniref:meiotic recombination protein REC8 homolog n=1 Tax=Gasterosteus aculeatus aculeatus TaxID=481459 RepID=UPI001A97E2FA|nr:meiotic recombination protein REC8 homolog [Gasterosteus aculeatus aculeatus]
MFYYPTVLQRHSGCFSTIWLVATKAFRVPRRDFLKVNVKSTCDDIMNYVLEQVAPPRPGLPRPRFSLYLSSQLQYGVVVVFHQQCVIFLEELQTVVGQLTKQKTCRKIDMDGDSRPAVDAADALSLLEEAEGAPDPLFGVMYMQEPVPSPNTLLQMSREYLRESSPQHPEMSPTPSAAAVESGITASPDSITLREAEPDAIPLAEFEGEELIDHHPDTLDLLMAQTDDFPEEGFEMQGGEVTPGDQERETEKGRRDKAPERDGAKELPGSPVESQPTTSSSEDAIPTAQEESNLPGEKPGPPSDQVTPVSGAAVPSRGSPPPSEDEPPVKVRAKRRRQLIFFDSETQINPEVLQQQINDPLIETAPPLYPPSPSHAMPSPAELFNSPCSVLPVPALFLWRRAANIHPASGADLRVGEREAESSGSEKERDPEMIQMLRAEALKGKEVPRDVAEPVLFNISEHGSLLLEASDQRETSREISPMYASEKEGSTISRSASALRDIPEAMDELPGIAAAEASGPLPDFPMHEMAPVGFWSLVPPDADRRTVSNSFQRLLEALSARRLRVEQDEPYGDMLIFPGTNYEDVHVTI